MTSSIHLGPLNIQLYGLVLLAAVWVGLLFTEKRFKKEGLDQDLVWQAALLTVPLGIVGARLYHVISFFEFYRRNVELIFAVWDGGLGIFGAILGGVIGLWIFLKVKKAAMGKLGILRVLDLAALGLTLGQAIGRWGNFFNFEILGKPTNAFWGVAVPFRFRPEGFFGVTKFHPLFAYESLVCLVILAALLFWERKRPSLDGEIFFLYLLLYGLGRFFLEYLRLESWSVNGVRVAQLVSLFFVVSGLFFFLFNIVVAGFPRLRSGQAYRASPGKAA